MKKPYQVIGLTGGLASGKDMLASLFAEKGVPVLDADVVSREISIKGTEAGDKIIENFGDKILDESGQIDRSALRKIVFNDKKSLRWLEELLHPLIRREINRLIKDCKTSYENSPSEQAPYCLLVSPLLLETDQYKLCDKVIVIDIPRKLQFQRACQRDNITRDLAERIINIQLRSEDRNSRADWIVDNSKDVEYLRDQMEECHQKIISQSSG